MSQSTRNSGTQWSASSSAQLKTLANRNTPTRVIGFKLGRTPAAIRQQAHKLNVTLKPTNQSPYNRHPR